MDLSKRGFMNFLPKPPPNFQTFHPFGPTANYHLYDSSPPNFQGFQQQKLRRRPDEKRSTLKGTKKPKPSLKGKEKKPAPSPLGDQPSQYFVLFNKAEIESRSGAEICRSNYQINRSKEGTN
uniref:Uncharacterized protein n=1 Tax=Oryza glumipatula TaxID=40148 RepID=A0A0E0AUC3_9ORYZ